MYSAQGYATDPEAGVVLGLNGKPLRTRLLRSGYVEVHRTVGGKYKQFVAHRLIWESVHGPIPEGMQINHINGIKTDNRISNLEMVTPSENVRHAFRTGLRKTRAGEAHERAVLTESQVVAIRQRHAAGEKQSVLAAEHGVSFSTVNHVINRRSWRHV